MTAVAYNFSPVIEAFRRFQSRFVKNAKLPPESQRIKVRLNPQGETVPLELALNSRCTSDYNGRQYLFHWGLFDPQKRLDPEDIQALIARVQIPRFTNGKLKIRAEDNMLYFLMAEEPDTVKHTWMMIESGMQQQVVCLLCAAFGTGMVFNSLKDNEPHMYEGLQINTRMKLDAMLPSYDGSYWCESVPDGRRSWLKGNLSAPDRKGTMSLTELVQNIGQGGSPSSSKNADSADISQLLWAAKGRTPHYYKSQPWGMTIPVARGLQHRTSMHLFFSGRLFQYSNWKNGSPTHQLEEISRFAKSPPFLWENKKSDHNCCIFISCNERTDRAFWEVGFQLINIILQAKTLSIDVNPYLVNHEMRKELKTLGIEDAWAIVSMRIQNVSLLNA